MSTVSLENRVSPVRTAVDLAAKMDAGPIALAAFASSTLVLSAVNAQLIDKSAIQAVIASAWVMGGLVQFVVGVFCLTKGRLFGGVAFTSFGGFWLASFRTSRALVVGLGTLLVPIATLVLGQATSSESWLKIGGFLGLVLALGVFYIAGAELINQVYARQILPLGDLNVGEEHRDADRG